MVQQVPFAYLCLSPVEKCRKLILLIHVVPIFWQNDVVLANKLLYGLDHQSCRLWDEWSLVKLN